MAKITVVNDGNIFPGTVSIADLAANTEFLKESSKNMTIYYVEYMMRQEWKWEIESFDYEYATGYSAKFKDGSEIHIGAWSEGEDVYN
jgi:hypothetical protein